MMAIEKNQIKKAGFDGTTDLVKQLSFGNYNQKFKPNRTTADWLCAALCLLAGFSAAEELAIQCLSKEALPDCKSILYLWKRQS